MSIEYRGEKFSGYNKPKRTPKHPTKSHVVLAKEGDTIKMIRFGEQGAKTAGKPKAGESEAMKKKRASFKARHAKNIKKGNEVKVVRFGDPDMSIKKDNPERRKSFRARHNCDTATDKFTARYWSCKAW